MKILHLSPNYTPINNNLKHGGVERIIQNLINEQSHIEEIKKIYLATLKNSYISGCEIINVFPEDIQKIRQNDIKLYENLMDKYITMIKSLIKEQEIDVIHDHFGYFSSSEKGAKYIVENKLNTIVTIYGLPENIYYKDIYKRLSNLNIESRKYIKINCVSQSHKHIFEKYMFIDDYIYNGVLLVEENKVLFNHPKRNFYLSLASIQREKGHLEHIEYINNTDSKLIIIGKYDENLRQSKFIKFFNKNVYSIDSNTLNIEEIFELLNQYKIIHIPEINESLKMGLLSNSKALLYMVEWVDPLPLAILEAISLGVPVVSKNVGSIKEIINESNGVIIDEKINEKNSDMIQSKLNSLEYDNIKLKKIFTAEYMNAKYIELYKEARND